MAALRDIAPRRVAATRPKSRGSSIVTLPDDRLIERRPVFATDGEQPTNPTLPDRTKLSKTQEVELLAMARKRFQTVMAAETTLRHEMLEDLKFRAGEQWPDQIRTERANDKRPIITVNRIPQFVKQITNPQRQARPSIQVSPVGDGADIDTAEIIQGIIRHIEHTSHAEVAYDEAYEDAVVMGRGFFRVLTEFVDDGSFEQEVVVRRIANPFTVYFDPSTQELDYSDARYAFIVEDVPKDEYEGLYGEDRAQSLELFQSTGDRQPDWFPEGKIRIAEYFYVEEVDRTLALIAGPNGTTLKVPTKQVPKNTPILRERTIKERVIHWVKMNAGEVLEHKIWPGRWIPIIPILGDEIDINGQKNLVGLVRYARDPQRMYNYWVSAETEMIALAPKVPFIGAEGQFKGHETEWKYANVKNAPFLEYVPVSLDGKPVPPPQRQQFEPPIRAIVEATKQADNDLKAVCGFFDASLGQRGPDESGRAILARQKQGETANMNFIDNLSRALWHAGRVYLDLIPKVYDAPRIVHIMRADDSRKAVQINQQFDELGVSKIFDVRVGRYNIAMGSGPSYQTKRQEAVASMLELVKADPQLVPIIGDLLVGEMDWPVARQISERLKKVLPPALQDQAEQDGPPLPPAAQAKIAALTQQLQMVMQEAQKNSDLIKSKQLDIDSRERVAMLTTQAQVAIAMARYGNDMDRAHLDKEFQNFTDQIDKLHERMLAKDEQDHAGAMASMDQQHQQAQQDSAQQHEQTLASADQAHQKELVAMQPPAPAGGA